MNTKEKVLQKCAELHSSLIYGSQMKFESGLWFRPNLPMGYLLNHVNFTLQVGESTDETDPVWPLAAQVLGISQWISVNDSLPELGQTVLSFGDQGIKQTIFTTYREGSIGHDQGLKDTWFEWVSYASGASKHYKVTHWMPIIETPKPNEV